MADVDPVLLALVPAGSTVIGGLISALTAAGLDRRRRAVEERNSDAVRRLDVKQATRLVQREIRETEGWLERAAQQGFRPVDRRAPTVAWSRWAELLARHLGIADWQRVSDAYDQINNLNWDLDAAARNGSYDNGGLRIERELKTLWLDLRQCEWILEAQTAMPGDPLKSLQNDREQTQRLFGGPPGAGDYRD